ncbi:MAG: asparagine synthase (glutamine-hydrolyzing) [Flavobacteriales bacterium]|nr:asparagine synthase (glutamine-hydrolyzing) [Flavobacteriales bacterium]
MCGISGIINYNRSQVLEDEVDKMNQRINHRGPDGEGIKINGCVGLGHKRLSIIDLSSAGHQPMSKYDFEIVFNGEIYNYIELREILINEHNVKFSSQTDTEVILSAYKIWGAECVNKFNGMWSFAIHDLKQDILFCSRDRFGIKPFVYGKVGEKFIFGSESKQFIDIEGFEPNLNRAVAYNFLENGLLNATEDTFFEGISELRGGHNLTFDLKKMNYKVSQWYDISRFKVETKISFEKAKLKFRELFKSSVLLRLRSDVKVGSCLSGGLDSSSIVSIASSEIEALETVSSCYEDKKYDEQTYIDIVNKRFKTIVNKTFPNLDDLYDEKVFEKMVYFQDQPFRSASHFSEYMVFKKASEKGLIVMLDGQGSDEYLAGYNEFFINFWRALFVKFRFRKLYKEIKLFSINRKSTISKTARYFFGALFVNNAKAKIKRVLGKETEQNWVGEELKKEFKNYFETKQMFKSLKDLGVYEILYSSIPYQLHSEDRNSMLHSIESRIPFLDFRLVEFSLQLPDELKVRNGESKAILRNGLSEDLPKEIPERFDKMGFVAPDEVWVRKNSKLIRKKLEEAIVNFDGLINENILTHFDKMIKNELSFNNSFFRVLSLDIWRSTFKVSF